MTIPVIGLNFFTILLLVECLGSMLVVGHHQHDSNTMMLKTHGQIKRLMHRNKFNNTPTTKIDKVNLYRIESSTENPLFINNVESFPNENGVINQHSIQSKSNSAQFLWKIYNFSELLCSGQEMVFSPRFYIDEPGFRLQVLLVTNTTYPDQVSYMGLFFRIIAGDYDGQLEWPYKYRTVLSVVEHNQLIDWDAKLEPEKMPEDIVAKYNHTVIPNIDVCRLRSAFLRPNSDQDLGSNPEGCGNRRQIPLSELESDRYLQEDTLLILITVHFESDSQPNFHKAALSMRYNDMVSNYLWSIEQFSSKKNDSVTKGQISILTSEPFYTHTNGYLIQLFMTILPKRSAFAVSIAFVQGDHDRYLQWPFPYSFEMAIVDQTPDYWKRDIAVKVKPSKSDCGTEAFGQPSPQPEFCFLTIQSLQVLSLKHYNFLWNDTLKIRFTTRFERYSSRQRSSILFKNNRLFSEFNWLIPGILTRFERLLSEKSFNLENSNTSLMRRTHRFVSDEFYTNGQGYLCQLILTVSVRTLPVIVNATDQAELQHYSMNNDLNSTTLVLDPSTLPSSSSSTTTTPVPPAPQLVTQDVLVFGLELVIIEGEYDRFLEWPFNSSYELSIVGYKSVGSGVESQHFYNSNQMNSILANREKKTNSQMIIPSDQVDQGHCVKEAFHRPIERNPPCGVKEFVQIDLNNNGKSHVTARGENAFYEIGPLSKTDEDLHLRVRIFP